MSRLPAFAVAAVLAATAAPARAALDFAPTANVQYDVVRLDPGPSPVDNTSAFRRARLGFKVKGATWQFVAEHDFADRTPADAYFEWTPTKNHSLRAGQFKQPFLLEDAISDKHLPMTEAASPGSFAYGRRIGVGYGFSGRHGTIDVATFDQRVDGTQASRGASARGTWLLRQSAGEILHVGASLASDSPDNHRASFSVNAGSALTPLRLAGSGTLTGVDRIDRGGLEALWIHGAASLQAEAAHVAVRRSNAGTFDGDAESVLATWSPTGHARGYKRGVPVAPTLNGRAAWELAARWSATDLDDGHVAVGRVHQLALAAIYTPDPHVRVLASVARSTAEGRVDEPLLATLRLQLTY
jgi:phosphate-selective porin OprO/OprP